MTRKSLALLILIIIIPALLSVLWSPDRARIKSLIKKGAESIEQKDIDGVMSCVSFNYRDEHGLTYLSLKESFKKFFQRYGRISIEYENLTIKVNDREAMAGLDVRVIGAVGKQTRYIAGDISDPVRVVFHLEKERLKWQFVKTSGIPSYYF
jgi:hypothetical protein